MPIQLTKKKYILGIKRAIEKIAVGYVKPTFDLSLFIKLVKI